ncbi:hypothetical protein Q5752_005501 [Cryptotrichosporon argae]
MPSPPLSIVQSLSPRIAVLASADVDDSCEANGCRGLDELLRPWEGGTERVSVLSSTLTPTIHPSFPLRFVSHASVCSNSTASLDADVVVDLIGSFVGARRPEEDQHYPLTRSLLLSSRPLAAHETFSHPVGVLIAVSTSTPDPLGTLAKLVGQAVGAGAQAQPWLDGVQVMRFFVVVHDVGKMGKDLAPANDLLAGVKKAYGPHSTLLVINSRPRRDDASEPPPSPDVSTHPAIPLPRPPSAEESSPSSLSQIYASALSSLTLSPESASSAMTASDAPSTPSKPSRRKLYASRLDADDVSHLAALVRELVVQSLVPWMEARVREWNEVYHANRRGITGRLFGAGRKLFGSRPASPAPGQAVGYNAAKGYYPVNAVEALSRRLADFAFMLRDYKYAASVYDSLRRDFAQDRAMRYALAATEMYGLSLLLSHPYFLPTSPPSPPAVPPAPFTNLQHSDITSWLEQAVLGYNQQGPASQIQLDAQRITVLYYEAWKALGEWRGVGTALVKAAGEADEVPSGVLIEEAAAADVRGGCSRIGGGKVGAGAGAGEGRGRRRQAFHLVMAARRYETAGLKAYSRRCLERASGLVRTAAWTAARDRIEYSLGRQAYTLGQADVAVEHFLRLLQREDTGAAGSQGMVLEDLALAYEVRAVIVQQAEGLAQIAKRAVLINQQLVAHRDLHERAKDKLALPTPVFDVNKTRIVVPSDNVAEGSAQRWADLESRALSTWDRKGKRPAKLLPDDNRVVASVGETFYVEIVATNPINAPVVIADLTVTLESSCASGDAAVGDVGVISEVALAPYETRTISVPITPTSACAVTVTAASFKFHRFFPVVQTLERRGKRLNTTKQQRKQPSYARDTARDVVVVLGGPRVEVGVVVDGHEWGEGEQRAAVVRLRNTGKVGVDNVQLLASEYGVVRLRGDSPHMPQRIPPHSSIALAASLAAGGTLDVPVLLTAPAAPNALAGRAAAVDIALLATYTAAGEPDEVGASRAQVAMSVKSDVTVTADVRRGKEGYLVVVDVRNLGNEPVRIDSVEAVSRYWKAKVAALPDSDTLPHQVLRTFLSVTPAPTLSLAINQPALVADLGRVLTGDVDGIAGPPAETLAGADFGSGLADWAAYAVSRRRWTVCQCARDFAALPTEVREKLVPLLDPLDLDLAVSYTVRGAGVAADAAAAAARSGTVFVHALRPAPRFSLVEPLRAAHDAPDAARAKPQRTMYEETGRIRRAVVGAVLDGPYGVDEVPLELRMATRATLAPAPHSDDGAAQAADGPATEEGKVKVVLNVWNRSPGVSARWVVRFDQVDGPAQLIGSLDFRGELAPNERRAVDVGLWAERGTVGLGWTAEVESGERREADNVNGDAEGWTVRQQWSLQGKARVEIV